MARRPPDDAETGGQRTAPGREVLRATGIVKHVGRRAVLAGLDLAVAAGEVAIILGARGSGKSTLARILLGLSFPDAGVLRTAAPVAPLVGSGNPVGTTGRVDRDLGLIAAAYGIDTGDYIAAVAALLDDPGVLARPFAEIDGQSRTLLNFGASYLVPAPVYVADGLPIPSLHGVGRRIMSLFEARRAEAGIIGFSYHANQLQKIRPERLLLLEGGRLRELDGLAEATALFGQPRGRLRRLGRDPADGPEDG